jgi:hypothetical protein
VGPPAEVAVVAIAAPALADDVGVRVTRDWLRRSLGLERRTARGGKDSIDHAPNAYDDLANSVAGVVAALLSSVHGYDSSMDWVSGPESGQGLSLWQHSYFNGGRSRW